MKLTELQKIDELLNTRAYLKCTIDNIRVNEVRCLSIAVADHLSCKTKIMKQMKGVEQQIGIKIYDTLVEELHQLDEDLRVLGVDVTTKKYITGEKKATMEALTDEVDEPKVHDENMRHYRLGIPEDLQFTGVTNKYE